MQNARYIDVLRDADVLTVAEDLGLEVIAGRGTSPGSFACPACGAETRHGERVRGACGVRQDGRGWRCFECQESGDAITLVTWALCGKGSLRQLSDSQRDQIREWVYRRDGIEPPERKPPPVRIPKPPPPVNLIRAIWEESYRVDEDSEVAAWLESKCIDVNRVADMDLARALPRGSLAMPDWANHGRRLVVPLRDAAGVVRSMKARRIDGGPEPKSVSPTGFSAAGLCFFDPSISQPRRVWVVEGEKKFLQLATRYGDDSSVAVFGVGSGMYTPQLIARIPDDAVVFVATDPNEAGAKYATDIIRMLMPSQRARARLWKGLEVVGEPGNRRVVVSKEPAHV